MNDEEQDDNDCYDGEGIDDDDGDDAKVATKVFPADWAVRLWGRMCLARSTTMIYPSFDDDHDDDEYDDYHDDNDDNNANDDHNVNDDKITAQISTTIYPSFDHDGNAMIMKYDDDNEFEGNYDNDNDDDHDGNEYYDAASPDYISFWPPP